MAELGAAGIVALSLDLLLELVRWIRGRRKCDKEVHHNGEA